ncbi:hypothetical protein [Chromobacterium subtsugae]|uniref:hypothetical protein n=1 Tax=Chromobacterium subtsugae TaxID=251747 RepID=UPI0007F86FF3|nr:hypothetical protein [Chromobacterium subtsugae]OBU84520.1 hypothetical protein MY55_21445 [Chromobacterium subtsugae]
MNEPNRTELLTALLSDLEEVKSERTSSAVVVCRFLQDGELELARSALTKHFEPAEQRYSELVARMSELALKKNTNEQEQPR